MVYRKGEITAADRERDYPHLCASKSARAVSARRYWTCTPSVGIAGSASNEAGEGKVYCTFCFADPAMADEFAARFEGRRGTRDAYPPGVLGRNGVVSNRI